MAVKIRALIVTLLVTAIFIAWIGFSSDWQEVWSELREINWLFVILAAFFALPVQWLRARRFKLLLNLDSSPDWSLFRVAGLLLVFNTLMPFRLGELSFPLLVNRAFGISKAYALGVLTFVRCFDFALVIILLALTGGLLITRSELHLLALFSGSAALVVIMILVFCSSQLSLWLQQVTGSGSIGAVISRLAEGTASLKGHHRLLFFSYSLTIWLLLGAMATLAAMAVIPELLLLQGYFAAAAANIGFALPVSGIAGLGPAQIAWAEALRLDGYPYSVAIASSLAVHVAVLTGIALTALVVFLKPNHNPSGATG